MWRIALLSAVFAVDAVLLLKLIREEVRDWRADHRVSDPRKRCRQRTGTF
jgi:hypothetical protein